MSQYHEPANELSQETRDLTRAFVSLKEEAEAIDWYNQRIDLTTDEDLTDILKHNQEEEIEHFCMLLEWVRRNMPGWDEQLETYLFTSGSITELEENINTSSENSSDLGLGDLK